jgi:hypothetical protein
MSRTFTDAELVTWEAFATGGRYGLSVRPRVVFQSVSDPSEPPRHVVLQGHGAAAERLLHDADEDALRSMLLGADALG